MVFRVLQAAPIFTLVLLSPVANGQMGEFDIPDEVIAILDDLSDETQVGFAVLNREAKIICAHRADEPFSSASSIKSAILLELFAKYGNELSKTSRFDIQSIVRNDEHPAIAHFGPATRNEIAIDLADVSIFRLGKIMIDSTDEAGKSYSNTTYNAAANVAIGLLGGPAKATERIHRRHPAFQRMHLRRYMLADRKVSGDNTATPLELATLFAMSIGENRRMVQPHEAAAATKILHSTDYPDGSRLYSKGGTLHSDPVTSVRSGQFQRRDVRMNYAIMATQKLSAAGSGARQYKELSQLTLNIYNQLKKRIDETPSSEPLAASNTTVLTQREWYRILRGPGLEMASKNFRCTSGSSRHTKHIKSYPC